MAKAEIKLPYVVDKELLGMVTDNGTEIAKLIANIKKQNTNLLKRVAVAAASCVCHAIQHGDVSKADMLVDALEGWRRNDLRQWFLDNGPFMWVDKDENGARIEGKFKLNPETKDQFKQMYKREADVFMKNMLEIPFWIAKKEPEFKPFKLVDELMKVIAKADRIKRDKQKSTDPRNDLSHYDEVKRFVQSFIKEDEPTENTEELAEAA